MKDFFGELGNNPKFDSLVKLAFYSLFVIAAIILINSADLEDTDEKINDDTKDFVKLEINDSYEYSYNINIDEKIYTYYGNVLGGVNTFKKNKDNTIYEYKYESDNYYLLDEDEYVIIDVDDVYDIIDYEYMDINKINYYLENSKKIDGKYYTYLKDKITGEDTDVYIMIEKVDDKILVDYSKLDDEYDKFVVIFEYQER